MQHLREFLKSLPERGLGEAIEPNYISAHTIFKTLNFLKTAAENQLVFFRASHLQWCEQEDIDPVPFPIWMENQKTKEWFSSYMLRNFPLDKGHFVVDVKDVDIDDLCKQCLERDI